MRVLELTPCLAVGALAMIEGRLLQNSECLEWTGRVNPKGYGRIKFRGRSIMVHRIALAASGKFIPNGKIVCHKCDNPRCCNPIHLYVGDDADNTRDKMSRGRQHRPIGEAHPFASLNWDKVREIRSGKGSRKALAEKFGVSIATIGDVRGLRTWTQEPQS